MKVVLLKRVRRRYSVVRVVRLAPSADKWHRDFAGSYGLPLYEIRDRDTYGECVSLYPDRASALEGLFGIILRVYGWRFKKRAQVEEKVWHVSTGR